MKVLMIITGLGMGGAEHVVVNLADALAKLGHQVVIAYLTGNSLVLPADPSIKVVAIGMVGARSIISAYINLRGLLVSFKPDVVHSHMVHANILARLLRLSINIPRLICTAHSNNEGGRLRMLAYRLTDCLADISTNVSDDAVAAFVAQGAVKSGRMISVVNGIDTNKFKFDATAREHIRAELSIGHKHMLLAIGRLDVAKDYPNLLHSVAILKKYRQDFQLFIVGHGPLKTELEQLAKGLELSEHVKFLGVRRDIPELLSASDIFVLSSEWEGFSLVVAEAMACERIVIATDCGGVKEVLGSSDNLVETKNPDALANKIEEALTSMSKQHVINGSVARQRIQDFYSLDAVVAKYIKLYS